MNQHALTPHQEMLPETQTEPSLSDGVAKRFKTSRAMVVDTIKNTVYKPGRNGAQINPAQLFLLFHVINKYRLDPFTRQLYALPDKNGGVVPVLGVDGWISLMERHPQYNGYELSWADEKVTMPGAKPCPEWMQVKIHHKNRQHPTMIVEHLDECYRDSATWKSHTKRMLRHKTLIQAIRVAFGFGGIYDPDEAQRIVHTHAIDSEAYACEPQAQLTHQTEQLKQKLAAANAPKPLRAPQDTETEEFNATLEFYGQAAEAFSTEVEAPCPEYPKTPSRN